MPDNNSSQPVFVEDVTGQIPIQVNVDVLEIPESAFLSFFQMKLKAQNGPQLWEPFGKGLLVKERVSQQLRQVHDLVDLLNVVLAVQALNCLRGCRVHFRGVSAKDFHLKTAG